MTRPPLMHDLKPERSDLSPPLPRVLMLLPVLFYLGAAASIALGALFTVKTKQAQSDEQRAMDEEQAVRLQITALQQDQKVVEEAQARAKEVEAWMHSTQPLMEVVTAVINSVRPGNTLSSLRLSRSPEKPEYVEMRVEINSGGTVQKEETVQALVKEGYQTFKDDLVSPNKNDRLGEVTYTATLVKASNGEQ